MNRTPSPFLILGCGYVGTRLAQSLREDGVPVRVCGRRAALLEPLRALGAEVHYLDASRSHQFGPALLGLDQPVVVYTIPGIPELPPGEAVRRAATAALKVHARAFIYLSSSGVYGRSEGYHNDEWIDEDSPVATADPEAGARLADEAAIQAVAHGGLRTVILRLSAIYGPALSKTQPARGVRQRLRSGQYKLWDGGRYFFSRVYVDDLVRVIRSAAERAAATSSQGSLYVVGDDEPCTQLDYATWLCAHLKLPLPPSFDSHQASGPGHAIRGRRLNNTRLKRELGFSFLYPTFREGEAAIDACEASTRLPPLRMAPTGEPAAPPVAAKKPLPPLLTAQAGLDFGVALGESPLGVTLINLAPGHSADPGCIYLVLSGQLAVTRDGQTVEVGPKTLLPATATLRNTGSATAKLLAIRLPIR